MRCAAVSLLVLLLLTGCRTAGTTQQELAQLRERAATLEAENAHLRGQLSLLEFERNQLREQVNELSAEAARLRAAGAPDVTGGTVAAGTNLVVMPKEVYPGAWVAVHVRNIPTRLLPYSGVALRTADGKDVQQIADLSQANVFLLTVPKNVRPGQYEVVLGEKGLPKGARVDDTVSISVLAP